MKRARKIAFVDLGTEFTGAQAYARNLLPLLSDDALLWLIKVAPQFRLSNSPKSIVPVDLGFSLKWGRAVQIPLCMLVILWLRLRYGLTTVWVNGYPEIALMPWARLLGMHAMATRHLTLVENKPKMSWLRSGWRVHFLYEKLAPFAHRIVCVSDAVRESMKTCVPEDRLVVIRNWIPRLPEPRTSDRSTLPLRLLFVGRLIELKGAHLILDAMRLLEKERGSTLVSLVIVGDGDEHAALKTAASGLDVAFVGFHKDPSQFYRDADVFINPSLGPEGLPLVSLDAMSYGLPCIFSDLPVHNEITSDGQAALLFERGNAADLARAIAYLLDNPQTGINYGYVARQIAGEMFTADFARRRYLDELNLLASS